MSKNYLNGHLLEPQVENSITKTNLGLKVFSIGREFYHAPCTNDRDNKWKGHLNETLKNYCGEELKKWKEKRDKFFDELCCTSDSNFSDEKSRGTATKGVILK